ncbi:hypothetical protein L227DRAFT_494536 [Lentinus tigrinus ALCF2SS1-6]|uniref:Uncharacterized protein n=1 Tax=Lentinus tigrinus ALCF2SS1-6 TaxID=1328759 RepID=A0A5C2SMM6_9APHY|nr:hypothetical protein L227DRAFT_494536 [Lentinus tigrinus ALCF2SS1-6]
MDRRGRSRDVSPIALARRARHSAHCPNHLAPASYLCACSASPVSPPGMSKPPLRDPRDPPVQPLASSSRLPPLPSPLYHTSSLSTSPSDTIPRTHSSSSVLSDASDPTPLGPITPPDADQQYALERPLDYYDSPPSPPRSLQDQMHVAYALENMHLAKVLLLKLKGIEVNGDDDPRIAEVRDEDFSSSFVPEGGLRLDAETEARVQEAERRAREAQKRRERDEKLRRLERVWENSMRRFKSERQRITRAKEEAQREQRAAERREKERERERARKAEAARAARATQLRIASGQPRQLLCYDSLRNADARFPKPTHAKDKSADSGLFMYDIMPSPPSRPLSLSPPCSRSPTDKDDFTLPRVQREFALKHAKTISRSVAFSDVLTAMHGPLFVEEDRPYARCKPQQAELLATLLEPVEKVEEKGKARGDALSETVRRRQRMKNPVAARVTRSSTMDSVSSTSSAASSSVSTVTRSGSWFSFGSKSSFRSTSTALTTPSSSPLIPSKPSIILSGPLSSSPPSDSPLRARRQSSKPPVTPSVPAADHPLVLPVPPRPQRKEPLAVGRGRPLTRCVDRSRSDDHSPPPSPSGLVHRVSRSVSTFMDFAAQFQRAYVKATMFSAGVDLYGRSPSRSTSRSPSRSPVRSARVRYSSVPRRLSAGLKPAGYRASSLDVHVFTAADASLDGDLLQYHRTLIPLCPPSADTLPAHERVFPLPPSLPRSPFRPQFQPDIRLSRMRPVANPILLRLQALHNVCQARALSWHRARDGTLAAGKEKIVGIAWEGIGRSSLGWEVSVVY